MDPDTTDNPKALLAHFSSFADPRRTHTLEIFYRACERHHRAGSKDFRTVTIARLVESEFVCTYHSLCNASGKPYRQLIAAFARSVGGWTRRPSKPKSCNCQRTSERAADSAKSNPAIGEDSGAPVAATCQAAPHAPPSLRLNDIEINTLKQWCAQAANDSASPGFVESAGPRSRSGLPLGLLHAVTKLALHAESDGASMAYVPSADRGDIFLHARA